MAGDEHRTEFPTLSRTVDGRAYAISAPRMTSTDRYQIGEQIGRGGMGEVLGAQDLLIGREVAIKRLRSLDVSDTRLTRFMREACIQGRLDHPAIVPVHELGVDRNGMPYFVMKKLSGTTLARIVAKPDPVRHSRQRLLRAFVEICLAVEFAHTRGYLHRDLKPENIVLGEFGEVYVIDWGIAKVLGTVEELSADTPPDDAAATAVGLTVGTPGYMAPEQVRAERDLDARCDVYALGCVLYEILCGERLHPPEREGLDSTLRGADARPSRRAPGREIAPELDTICVAATQLRREDRPDTARALAEKVERFLDGDRDLELRKRLAREQLEVATQAFAASDITESRRAAMRHAGRALALDPTSIPAAELVGRLMLEPPRQIPAEVTRSVAQEEFDGMRRLARVALYAHAGYVIILALIGISGYSSPIYPLVFSLLIALNVGVFAFYAQTRVPRTPLVPLVTSAALLALISRMFGPLLVGPAIATTVATAFMLGVMKPTVRDALVTIAVITGAALAPWLAELLGYLSPTFQIGRTKVELFAPGFGPAAVPHVVFAMYAFVLVAAGVLMAAAVRRAEARIRARMHLQAWQLRQLVPVKEGPEDY
jgi:serine/threonine-protein kinase